MSRELEQINEDDKLLFKQYGKELLIGFLLCIFFLTVVVIEVDKMFAPEALHSNDKVSLIVEGKFKDNSEVAATVNVDKVMYVVEERKYRLTTTDGREYQGVVKLTPEKDKKWGKQYTMEDIAKTLRTVRDSLGLQDDQISKYIVELDFND